MYISPRQRSESLVLPTGRSADSSSDRLAFYIPWFYIRQCTLDPGSTPSHVHLAFQRYCESGPLLFRFISSPRPAPAQRCKVQSNFFTAYTLNPSTQ